MRLFFSPLFRDGKKLLLCGELKCLTRFIIWSKEEEEKLSHQRMFLSIHSKLQNAFDLNALTFKSSENPFQTFQKGEYVQWKSLCWFQQKNEISVKQKYNLNSSSNLVHIAKSILFIELSWFFELEPSYWTYLLIHYYILIASDFYQSIIATNDQFHTIFRTQF